ncbi:hypothetical protein PJI20_29540, partial [Mycobacterium kansasii]
SVTPGITVSSRRKIDLESRDSFFKFHLLFPSWSLGEDENALPSTSHAYSTLSVFPHAISCQNSFSRYVAGRHPALHYL